MLLPLGTLKGSVVTSVGMEGGKLGVACVLLTNMVIMDLPLYRPCASISPSADTSGSQHTEEYAE